MYSKKERGEGEREAEREREREREREIYSEFEHCSQQKHADAQKELFGIHRRRRKVFLFKVDAGN